MPEMPLRVNSLFLGSGAASGRGARMPPKRSGSAGEGAGAAGRAGVAVGHVHGRDLAVS